MSRRRLAWAMLGALAVLGPLALAAPAVASFHLMKIREVSSGTGPADSSYAEIQMYAPGQSFLAGGARLVRCDSTCSAPTTFSGFANVANGSNQSTVVFGDSGLPTASRDFAVNLNLDAIAGGGALCYLSEPGFSDCVSWGSFSADATLTANYGTSAGTPAPALSSGMALRRSIAPGCPTLLEAADDTNNSSVDFAQLVTPAPRPNPVAPTEVPCSTTQVGSTYPTPPPAPKKKRKCKKKHRRSTAKKKRCKRKKHRAPLY